MRYIVKRDGNIEEFNKSRFTDSIKDAFISVAEYYDNDLIVKLSEDIINKLTLSDISLPTVELILDLTEETLMEKQYYKVAKNFILYRYERDNTRKLLESDEEYDLSFIEHHDYKDKDIIVWDYHKVSDEIKELDINELFNSGIGELTHIKDLKSFSDILCMKLISYRNYNGTLVLKSFQNTLSKAVKENYRRYYYDYLTNALNLMCTLNTKKVVNSLKVLHVQPDLDHTQYLDAHKAELIKQGLDDMIITHLLTQTLKSAYKHINEVVYYYVNAIDDIILSYQECVEPICPRIKIELKHPQNIEEQIIVEALIKITGIGDYYE